MLDRNTIKKLIDYISKDSEVMIPVERLFDENGNHITKNTYGKILLEILCEELKEKFLASELPTILNENSPIVSPNQEIFNIEKQIKCTVTCIDLDNGGFDWKAVDNSCSGWAAFDAFNDLFVKA